MKPVTISLWADYSDQDATEIAKLQGPFPIVLATRLSLSPYYGKFQKNINQDILLFKTLTKAISQYVQLQVSLQGSQQCLC